MTVFVTFRTGVVLLVRKLMLFLGELRTRMTSVQLPPDFAGVARVKEGVTDIRLS